MQRSKLICGQLSHDDSRAEQALSGRGKASSANEDGDGPQAAVEQATKDFDKHRDNPFQELGIDHVVQEEVSSWTKEQIRSAYRRKTLEVHPDKSGGDVVKL